MKKVILFLTIGFLFSCGDEKPGDAIHSLTWLEGTWINNSDTVTTASEKWQRTSPLSYDGFGMTMSEGDTLFYENLKILQENGTIYYIANVGEGPVWFKLTSRSEDKWVFSNPDHDFPKKIIYSRKNSGNDEWLVASAEGNGKQIPFKFKKVVE